jgi:hypothetical protein
MLNGIPTVDTTVKWEADKDADMPGVRKSVEPKKASKTELTKVPVEMSPATKEHKAQVMVVDEQKVVGTYYTEEVTGCLTPHEKMTVISYADEMIRNLKIAKAAANGGDVPDVEIGAEMVDPMLALLIK